MVAPEVLAESPVTARARSSVVLVHYEDYPWDVRIEKFLGVLTSAFADVHLLARNRKHLPEREMLGEVTCHRLPPVAGLAQVPAFFNPVWFRKIGTVVKAVKPSLLIIRDLPLVLAGRYWANRLNIPLIYDMAEDYPAMFSAYHPWESRRERAVNLVLRNELLARMVERKSVHAADHILVVTEEQQARLQNMGVPAEKITVIRNTPVTIPEIRRPAPNPELQLIYVGEVHHFRGLDCAIRAVGRLVRKGMRVRLKLLGRGKTEDVLKALAAQEAPANVDFLGWVEPAEAQRAVARADVGLVPHVRNPFTDTTVPNKIYDYMGAGLPVVTSDPRPLKRLVEETRCGLVYPSGDDAAMAAAIERLGDTELRRELGANGAREVRQRYHWAVDAEVLRARLLESAKVARC